MKNNDPIVLVLGFFDGVHLGHQELLKEALKIAKLKNLKTGVFSFKNHPLTEIFPRYAPKLIMSNEDKVRKIKSLGIDEVYLVAFTEDMRKMEPKAFFEEVLLKNFNLKDVVVGYNYSFGYKGKGKADDLKKLAKEYGVDVHIVSPIMTDDQKISSTYIRELLSLGKVEEASRLLGHPYKISGTIKEGKKLGRKFNIPTANLHTDSKYLMPKSGVYFTRITIDGKTYDGLTNLGKNPTFEDHPYAIETYIYDFDEDIYNKEVDLEFLKFIRGEVKFNGLEELFGQVQSDINKVNLLYRKNKNASSS